MSTSRLATSVRAFEGLRARGFLIALLVAIPLAADAKQPKPPKPPKEHKPPKDPKVKKQCRDVICVALDDCHDVGVCDAKTGECTNPVKLDGSACDDDDACTALDLCITGVCRPGVATVCGAPDACHAAGTCDPDTGDCSNPAAPDGAPCDDGDACTRIDACVAGACTAGPRATCNAADACHIDGTCDPFTGLCDAPVVPNGTACTDGNACTSNDTCQAGACASGSPVICDAADACHVPGVCDPGTGQCSPPVVANDDGDPCTAPVMGPGCAQQYVCVERAGFPIAFTGTPALGNDGTIYTAGRRLPVSDNPGNPGYNYRNYALRSADLSIQWGPVALSGNTCDVRSAGSIISPAVSESTGLFYVNGDWNDGSNDFCASLFGKRLADGSTAFSSQPGGPHPRHTIALDGNFAYYGGWDGVIRQFNASNGAILNSYGVGGGGHGGGGIAVGSDGNLFVSQGISNRYASFTPAGAVRWNVGSATAGPPFSLAGDNSVVRIDGNNLDRLSGATGQTQWSRAIAPNAPVLVDGSGNLYLTLAGRAVSYDAAGQLRWSTPLVGGNTGTADFLGADGRVYVTTQRALQALSMQDGTSAWTFTLDADNSGLTASLTRGGSILLADGAGTVYRLGSGFAYADAPWARPRGNRLNSGKSGDVLPMP